MSVFLKLCVKMVLYTTDRLEDPSSLPALSHSSNEAPFNSVGQILSLPLSCRVGSQPLNSLTDLNGTYSHNQPLVRMEREADII